MKHKMEVLCDASLLMMCRKCPEIKEMTRQLCGVFVAY